MCRARHTTPWPAVRAGPVRGRRSREPVRRIARRAALHAVAERQIAADARIFRDDTGPGARLGAGGADRRTRFCRGEAEPGARPGDGAGRPGTVRLVMGFCRGPRRNRRSDLAGGSPHRSEPPPDPPPLAGEGVTDAARQRTPSPASGGGLGWGEACADADRDRRNPRRRAARRGRRSSRALARPARRDRPLGAVEACHRQLAGRRIGPSREACARRMERQRDRGDRGSLARSGAPLPCPVRLARRPRRRRPTRAHCRPSVR